MFQSIGLLFEQAPVLVSFIAVVIPALITALVTLRIVKVKHKNALELGNISERRRLLSERSCAISEMSNLLISSKINPSLHLMNGQTCIDRFTAANKAINDCITSELFTDAELRSSVNMLTANTGIVSMTFSDIDAMRFLEDHVSDDALLVELARRNLQIPATKLFTVTIEPDKVIKYDVTLAYDPTWQTDLFDEFVTVNPK